MEASEHDEFADLDPKVQTIAAQDSGIAISVNADRAVSTGYSAFNPAALMIGHHLASSALRRASRACGLR